MLGDLSLVSSSSERYFARKVSVGGHFAFRVRKQKVMISASLYRLPVYCRTFQNKTSVSATNTKKGYVSLYREVGTKNMRSTENIGHKYWKVNKKIDSKENFRYLKTSRLVE